jgi:ESCRT-I complex subunit TSG101
MIQSPPSTSTQPTPHHRYSTPPAPPQSSPKPPPPFAHHQASPLHPSSPSSQQSPPPVPPPPPNAAIRPPRFQSLSPSPSSSTSPPPPPFLPPNFLSPTHTPGHGAQQFTRQHSQSTQFSPPLPPPVPHQPPPLVVPPAIVAPKIPPPNLMDDSEASSSLSQAPEHAVPPRPLNPALLALHANLHQKFSSSLQALSITHQETFSKLLSMQADLLKGPPAIADESARLEAVKELCTTVARRVGEVVRDAEGRIEDVKRRGEPSVDELVCSSDVVYNQ